MRLSNTIAITIDGDNTAIIAVLEVGTKSRNGARYLMTIEINNEANKTLRMKMKISIESTKQHSEF